MTSFFIAHVSDLHLSTSPNKFGVQHVKGGFAKFRHLLRSYFAFDPSKLTGSYDQRSLLPLADRLALGFNPEGYPLGASAQSHYDAIVVSGDIGTHGSLAEQSKARLLLGDILANALMSHPKIVFPIVPGNHDRYQSKHNLPGEIHFEDDNAFHPDWCPYHSRSTVFVAGPYRKIQVFSLTKEGANLTFLSIDCSLRKKADVRGWLRYLDEGLATDEILAEVDGCTRQLRNDGHAVVWIVHFPPVPSLIERKLNRQDKLLKIAHSLGVGVILSGHTHKNAIHEFKSAEKNVKVVVAGTALAYAETSSYRELHIAVDPNTKSTSLVEASVIERREILTEDKASCYLFSRL